MKVLNLYAGIGGNRKLWTDVDVVAVELDKRIAGVYQHFFPEDEIVIDDAHQFLLDNFQDYDFIWSSPPCPTHSVLNFANFALGLRRYPDMDLWQEIIYLKTWCKSKWVIENVKTFYDPLIEPQEVDRHYFWANFLIAPFKVNRGFNTTNARESTRMTPQVHLKKLQEFHGFILPPETTHKKQLLKNCVYPPLGKHILNCARGNTQKTFLEFLED